MVPPMIQEAMRSFLAHECQPMYDCAIRKRQIHFQLTLTCRRMNQRGEPRMMTSAGAATGLTFKRMVDSKLQSASLAAKMLR